MDVDLHLLDLRYEALRKRSPSRERLLLASLAEVGQQLPIVVVPVAGGALVLLDGYKRVRALRRLARDTVRATRWEMEESEALLLERLMRVAGEDALEHGWVLAELHERFGLSFDELARRFDKSKSWVSRRLSLVKELPKEIQAQVPATSRVKSSRTIVAPFRRSSVRRRTLPQRAESAMAFSLGWLSLSQKRKCFPLERTRAAFSRAVRPASPVTTAKWPPKLSHSRGNIFRKVGDSASLSAMSSASMHGRADDEVSTARREPRRLSGFPSASHDDFLAPSTCSEVLDHGRSV